MYFKNMFETTIQKYNAVQSSNCIFLYIKWSHYKTPFYDIGLNIAFYKIVLCK